MKENILSPTDPTPQPLAFHLLHTLPKLFSPRKSKFLKLKQKKLTIRPLITAGSLPPSLCRYQLPSWQKIMTNSVAHCTVFVMDYFHPLPHERSSLAVSYWFDDGMHKYRFEVDEVTQKYAFDYQSEKPWDFQLDSRPFREHIAESIGASLPTESDQKAFSVRLHGCRTIEIQDHEGKLFTFSPFRHSNDSNSHSLGFTSSEDNLWKVILLGGFFPTYRTPDNFSNLDISNSINGLLTQVTESYFNLFRDIIRAYRSFDNPQIAVDNIDTRFIMLSLQTVDIIYTRFWKTAENEWKADAEAFRTDKRYIRHRSKVKQIISKFNMTLGIAEDFSIMYKELEAAKNIGCLCRSGSEKVEFRSTMEQSALTHADPKCPFRASMVQCLAKLDSLEKSLAGEWQDPMNFLIENHILAPSAKSKDLLNKWHKEYKNLGLDKLAKTSEEIYRSDSQFLFWRTMPPNELRDFIAESFSRVLIGSGRVAVLHNQRKMKFQEVKENTRLNISTFNKKVTVSMENLSWKKIDGVEGNISLEKLKEMPRLHLGSTLLLLYTQPEVIEQYIAENPIVEGQEQDRSKVVSKLWCFNIEDIGEKPISEVDVELIDTESLIMAVSSSNKRVYAILDEFNQIENCVLKIWEIQGQNKQEIAEVTLKSLIPSLYKTKPILDDVNQQVAAANDYMFELRSHKAWFLIWSTEMDAKSKILVKISAVFLTPTGKIDNHWSLIFPDRIQNRESWNLPYRVTTFEYSGCCFLIETHPKALSFQLWTCRKNQDFRQLYDGDSSLSVFGRFSAMQPAFMTAAFDPQSSEVYFLFSFLSATRRGPADDLHRLACKLVL